MSWPLKSALVSIALATFAAPGWAQEAEVVEAESRKTAAVAVHLTLVEASITEEQIKAALAAEFGIPVVAAEGETGLFLKVEGRKLDATYRGEDGEVVERKMELPKDVARQLDTIALLSGNLARDEAGEILKSLQAEADVPLPPPLPEEEPEALPSDSPEETTPPVGDPEEAEPEPEPDKEKEDVPAESKVGESKEAEPKNSQERETESEVPELPLAEVSGALWGETSFPLELHKKKTNFHLGAVYSEFGSLDGFAANLLLLKNLGKGRGGAGSGAQATLIWTHTGGYFEGFSGSAIAATGEGGINGVQAAGIFTFQKNETDGGQAAGIMSLSMSHVDGAQGAGIFAGTWGDIEGAQGAGLAAITTGDVDGLQFGGAAAVTGGDVDGVQIAGGASIAAGEMKGVQIAAANWAGQLDGFQLGAFNFAHGGIDGLQIGGANYAGDLNGTQIGIVNVGGNVDGGQFGLINIAKDVDGIAFAPINIIPGIRNQIVTYGSWSPAAATQAAPAGPLVHLGLKFMPEPFYNQISLGVGAEAEECPSGALPGDASCVGNGVIYAPGFAFGLRGKIIAGLFTEVDLQYQFETAFGASSAHRHATLARAALGYDFDEKFAIFAGGGPRMDFFVDEGGVAPLTSWNPHAFAGIQVF